MASIVKEANGRRMIQLSPGEDAKRPRIRLGKATAREADAILVHVEALIRSRKSGIPYPQTTAAWLAHLPDGLRRRLESIGLLLADPKPLAPTIKAVVDAYIAKRKPTWAKATILRVGMGRKSLLEHFGEDRTIDAVSEADAEDYRMALLGKGYAEATCRKRCGDARIWFAYAVKSGHVRTNPFEGIPTTVGVTPNRAYISEADARLVAEQIEDPDVRLVFILARWGGLRVGSEPKALTWDCIDWARQRFIVPSIKTARHGKTHRTVPLFPEIAGPLQDAFDRAEPGDVYVVPMLHGVTAQALIKPVSTAIKRAGLKQWPRLFHNLRSSRQTDLEQRFPTHVVCAWLGNSIAVATRHYLQVRETDFAEAVGMGLDAVHRAVHNPVQQASERQRNGPQRNPLRPISTHCDALVAATGLEPVAQGL